MVDAPTMVRVHFYVSILDGAIASATHFMGLWQVLTLGGANWTTVARQALNLSV